MCLLQRRSCLGQPRQDADAALSTTPAARLVRSRSPFVVAVLAALLLFIRR